jgi:ethanolamine utilization microcompartment shell protein EutS
MHFQPFLSPRGLPPAEAISALTVKPELAHMIAEFLGEQDETCRNGVLDRLIAAGRE